MIGEIIDFTYYTQVGIVLLLPLVFVFLMCMVDLKRTKLLFRVFSSNQYFYAYSTDVVSNVSMYHVFGFGFISTLLALFLMPLLYNDVEIFTNFIPLYFGALLGSVVYGFVKYLVSEFLYQFSNKKKHCKQMLILETSYLASIFLVLYVLVFYDFLHLNHQSWFSNVLLISALVLYFIRLIALLSNNKNLMSGRLFYIILYLCTLEIFPFIYLFKGYIE
ncbi:DUF4271 domain-containing protein [Wenyingzhuangia aestuarii]|uniref:DUF4271 domain-containing protein n=1 Tax=Wenyingzhuangia aestuarii TaxID=1647582 RepID=UPI00143BAF64|nr:DUF4271 domain-containing protein [Wenyingzhuangia aestuarii]NJB82317.1 hypothetical protein [Wenyingzhuangia aestuarii]